MGIPLLIVDDNKFPRKMLIKALPEHIDFDVEEAANGVEALESIRSRKPDLVFLDLTMPELDGFGVLEALQKDGVQLNVIVVSADVQPKAVERVKELGAREFVKKPVSKEEVLRILNELGIS